MNTLRAAICALVMLCGAQSAVAETYRFIGTCTEGCIGTQWVTLDTSDPSSFSWSRGIGDFLTREALTIGYQGTPGNLFGELNLGTDAHHAVDGIEERRRELLGFFIGANFMTGHHTFETDFYAQGEYLGQNRDTSTFRVEAVAPVPAPFAMPLLLSGLVCLWLVGRRQARPLNGVSDVLASKSA
jgi:hypothetical protein